MIVPLLTGKMDLSSLSALLSGKDTVHSTYSPERLVTHSGEVNPGDLFIALRGKEDGYRYAKEAKEKGACAIIANRIDPSLAESTPHILTPDAKKALGVWARTCALSAGFSRIAVTGSVGKTTLSHYLSAFLSHFYPVHATKENENNDLGLPFTLLS
ncbi:MAG: hypothetical protein MJ078_05545, partial [Clostridia bacterium]|nr:hypothetical protein [Clostridia bacterium]